MSLQIHNDREGSIIKTTPPDRPGVEIKKQYYKDFRNSNLEGFIHHPAGYPIEWRTCRQHNPEPECDYTRQSHIGLCFEAEKYIKPGTLLELSINLRGETQKFSGRVILVRNMGSQFEIGVWFTTKSDASRLRIVEQICHIESYLRLKRHHEGPFVSPERVAQEWISRFASSFPSFG